MSRRDENTLPLAWAILALVVAVVAGVLVVIYVGIWQGILAFVAGVALLAGELEAMGLLSKDRE